MKKLLTIFTMAVLCGAIPATDSFADCDPGYSTSAPTFPTTNGSGLVGHYSHDGSIVSNNTTPVNLSSGQWRVTWNGNGTAVGDALCNTTSGTTASTAGSDDSWISGANGQYCWCRITGWIPDGGTLQDLSAAWVFSNDLDSSSTCAQYCAYNCAGGVNYDSAIRSAVFASVGASGACVANSISINWKNSSGGTQSSTSCTYDGTLTAPAAAPEKRGYTFTGWVAQ